MQIIISHMNTDFDALASMIAAKKIFPNAQIVISDKQDNRVRRFLNIYRDTFDFKQDHQIEWEKVTELIIVDVASLQRIGHFANQLDRNNLHITIYDHHPKSNHDVEKDAGVIEEVGAAVTLLIEEIQRRSIDISTFEATLFGLGIYTDTGAFTYKNTTKRDFLAASFLMEKGMNLEMIQQFSEQSLQPEQQALLDKLFQNCETIEIDSLDIIISQSYEDNFIRDLATLTTKLLEVKGADASISVVGMKKNVFVVGRARSERITLQPILKQLGGGGHHHAGSAMIKNGDYQSIYREVKENIRSILKPAITATDIMTSPVKTISPNTTIEKAGQLMYRYGHSGYPVVKDEKLVGIITRRDLDKANHHGLGHAPVKAYMTTKMITIDKDATLEEIQKLIIEHNIGRLPVLLDGHLIGIISRTNIIEALHGESLDEKLEKNEIKRNVKKEMEEHLQDEIFQILKLIGKVANEQKVSVYLIGGIVRDLFLNVQNDDVDIVVEGDGISFVKMLQQYYGGDVLIHESFGTATWIHPSSLEIDIASSRLEYYDKPASLPDVETSTLEEDLNRRDFTINAMAIYLNEDKFGNVVDPFSGQLDLYEKQIKVLHNISFVEDPTRILRAVRFEVRFDFLMDEQTENLALHSIEKVKNVSAERIMNEMKRLFKQDPLKTIKRLYELTFWQQFGVRNESAATSCHFLKKLERLHNELKDRLSLSQLTSFHYFLIPFYVDNQLKKAKKFAVKKNESKFLQAIMTLKEIDWTSLTNISSIHHKLKQYDPQSILFILNDKNDELKQLILNYLERKIVLKPLLTGEDLSTLGLKPGPIYSEILFNLEVEMLQDKVTSKDEAIKWVKQFMLKKENI